MRQIVKTIDAYRFDELGASAKENAMQNIENKITVWNDWWEPVMEQQKDWLDKAGLHNAEISFSLAYVQGDYCDIKCSSVDVKTLMKLVDPNKEIIDWEDDNLDINIEFRTSRFYPTTLQIFADDETYNKLDKALNDWLYCTEQDFYKEYMDEWEYYTSEESIADLCECNDYEFTKDGDLI